MATLPFSTWLTRARFTMLQNADLALLFGKVDQSVKLATVERVACHSGQILGIAALCLLEERFYSQRAPCTDRKADSDAQQDEPPVELQRCQRLPQKRAVLIVVHACLLEACREASLTEHRARHDGADAPHVADLELPEAR